MAALPNQVFAEERSTANLESRQNVLKTIEEIHEIN